MTNRMMPYVLPLASILVIGLLFAFAKPAVTGLFTAQQKPVLNAEIKIIADEILPEDAVVTVALLDKNNNTLMELINSGIKGVVSDYAINLSYTSGKNSELNYEGKGFLGWGTISLARDLESLSKGSYLLGTKISYKERVIFETQKEIRV